MDKPLQGTQMDFMLQGYIIADILKGIWNNRYR